MDKICGLKIEKGIHNAISFFTILNLSILSSSIKAIKTSSFFLLGFLLLMDLSSSTKLLVCLLYTLHRKHMKIGNRYNFMRIFDCSEMLSVRSNTNIGRFHNQGLSSYHICTSKDVVFF